MPTRCSNPSMRSSIRPESTPRLSIGKASSSSTLAQNSWDSGSCWTYPISLDSSAMLHSAVLRPATVIVPRMVPSSGFGMIPASAMHSVDLPAPVGPMMPVNDPGRIEKSSSFNALTGSPSSVCGVYHQLRWFAVMIGAWFISGRSIVCAVSAVCAVVAVSGRQLTLPDRRSDPGVSVRSAASLPASPTVSAPTFAPVPVSADAPV